MNPWISARLIGCAMIGRYTRAFERTRNCVKGRPFQRDVMVRHNLVRRTQYLPILRINPLKTIGLSLTLFPTPT